jgi:gas vesicle protein
MKRDGNRRMVRRQSPPRTAHSTTITGAGITGAGIGSALGLLAGVGVGAAVMYLLDPNQGANRRRQIVQVAGSAIGNTTDALGHAWSSAREHAGQAMESFPQVSGLRDPAGELAQSAAGHFAGGRFAGGHFAGGRFTAGPFRDRAGRWFESARSRLPYRLQRRPTHDISATAAGIGGVLAVAAGVGAMWLLDPQRGRGRRAWIRQKTNRFVNETGRFMNATGRHLRNKAIGASHKARSAAQSLYDRAHEAMPGSYAEDKTMSPETAASGI